MTSVRGEALIAYSAPCREIGHFDVGVTGDRLTCGVRLEGGWLLNTSVLALCFCPEGQHLMITMEIQIFLSAREEQQSEQDKN